MGPIGMSVKQWWNEVLTWADGYVKTFTVGYVEPIFGVKLVWDV